jgi:hypothetical protein
VAYRCHCFDGSYIWIDDKAIIVDRNADGSVALMIDTQRDINSQKMLLLHSELLHQAPRKSAYYCTPSSVGS